MAEILDPSRMGWYQYVHKEKSGISPFLPKIVGKNLDVKNFKGSCRQFYKVTQGDQGIDRTALKVCAIESLCKNNMTLFFGKVSKISNKNLKVGKEPFFAY